MHPCKYRTQKGDDRAPWYYCHSKARQVRPGQDCNPAYCRILAATLKKETDDPAMTTAAAVPAKPTATPVSVKNRRKGIAWDEPAYLVNEDWPKDKPLWEHCRDEMSAHGGQKGFSKTLTRAIDCSLSSMTSAIGTRERRAQPKPVTGGGTPDTKPTQPPAPSGAPDPVTPVLVEALDPDPEPPPAAQAPVVEFESPFEPLDDNAYAVAGRIIYDPDPTDLVANAGTEALSEFIQAYDMQDALDAFLIGWRRRGLKLAANVGS